MPTVVISLLRLYERYLFKIALNHILKKNSFPIFCSQEEIEKLFIPLITLPCKRKPHIVRYQLFKKIKDLVENRESIFEKCYPLSFSLARKMIVLSYKHPSNFGQWDPVKVTSQLASFLKPFLNSIYLLLFIIINKDVSSWVTFIKC